MKSAALRIEFGKDCEVIAFPFDDEHFAGQDANEPDHHPGYQPRGTYCDAFRNKTVSGRKHESAGRRIRDRDPKQTQAANEQEWKRTKTRRERRQGCRGQHRPEGPFEHLHRP